MTQAANQKHRRHLARAVKPVRPHALNSHCRALKRTYLAACLFGGVLLTALGGAAGTQASDSAAALALVSAAALQDQDAGADVFLSMDPITLTLFTNMRPNGQLTVGFVLRLSADDDYAGMKERMPQLRSDFLAALSYFAKQRVRINSPVDIDLLQKYLTPIARRRLESEHVELFVVRAEVNTL